jgi:hypothetical protein
MAEFQPKNWRTRKNSTPVMSVQNRRVHLVERKHIKIDNFVKFKIKASRISCPEEYLEHAAGTTE